MGDVCVYITDSYDICTIYTCVGMCVFVYVCDMIFVLHMLFVCAMYMCILLHMNCAYRGTCVCTVYIYMCGICGMCVFVWCMCGIPKSRLL